MGVLLSDEGKVGLDIEVMRARGTRQSALQHAHQTPAESARIGAQDDRLEAETQLWSIRQSVLKISGLGNSGGLRCVCIPSPATCAPAPRRTFR